MGFSDLISNGRGPGFIGTVIALIVLGGFGALFIVFDKDMQEDGLKKKIEAVIRDQGLEIDSAKKQAEDFRKRIKDGEKLRGQDKTIASLDQEKQSNIAKIEELSAGIGQARSDIDAAQKAWDKYKDDYREHAWEEAKGRKLGDVKGIKSGEIYKDVVISEVNHTGIKISNNEGIRWILLEDLPASLRDEFQLDEDSAEKIKQDNIDTLNKHIDQANLINLKQSLVNTERQITKTEEKIQSNAAVLDQKRRDLKSLRSDISRMPGKIRAEERKSLSKAPQMKQQLAAMQASVANAERIVRQAEADLQKERDLLPQLRKQAENITAAIKKKEQEAADKKAADAAGSVE